MSQWKWVETPDQVEECVSALSNTNTIGLDTEFIRETTFFPAIALIQVATQNRTWLVDPTVLNKDDLKPLVDIFQNKEILKIVHASYADQECLYWAYGILAEPVLDTSIAAALLGLGDNIGLGKLLKDVLGKNLPKGRARAKWLQRPLSTELLNYAAADVAYLVSLGSELKSKLDTSQRWEWALKESKSDVHFFDESPESMTQRICRSGFWERREYLILQELVRWREGRARAANLPRHWVADNEVLISLARSKPKSLDELRSFRGIGPKEISRSGELILQAIERGKNSEADVHIRPGFRGLTQFEGYKTDLLKTYVSFLSDRYQVAPRFLLTAAKLGVFLGESQKSVDHWVKQGLLSPEAAALIGEELKAFLSGKRGLAFKNGEVDVLSIE